jgi:ADP-ribose pyrophosphatase
MRNTLPEDGQRQTGVTAPGREYPDEPRVAVGAVVFHEDRVLLVKRGRPPSRALWAIPGGGVDLGETLAQAAEREVFEETGVRIRAGAPVYTFDHIERDGAGRVRFHYVIVDLGGEYIDGDIRPGDDALAVRWVAAEELPRLEVSARTLALLNRRFGFGPGAPGDRDDSN